MEVDIVVINLNIIFITIINYSCNPFQCMNYIEKEEVRFLINYYLRLILIISNYSSKKECINLWFQAFDLVFG